jgi:hypothetical protein
MNKPLAITIFILGLLLLSLGISALLAWLVSLGVAFVFDYHIGFIKTWVALFVINVVGRFLFNGIKAKEAK